MPRAWPGTTGHTAPQDLAHASAHVSVQLLPSTLKTIGMTPRLKYVMFLSFHIFLFSKNLRIVWYFLLRQVLKISACQILRTLDSEFRNQQKLAHQTFIMTQTPKPLAQVENEKFVLLSI